MTAKRETIRVARRKKTPAAKRVRSKPGAVRVLRVRDVLGTKTRVTDKMIREGLPAVVIGRLSEQLDLSTARTLNVVNLSKQTFARRQKAGKLTPEESDRVWRVADLVARANRLLGDEDAAAEWLRTPAPGLDGETPLERARTEIGARDVENLIGRLEHGIPT